MIAAARPKTFICFPGHENARRPDSRRAKILWSSRWTRSRLEHAEHDGADKGECEIGGDDAQSADKRTYEGHWEGSLGWSLPAITRKVASRSRPIKSALLSIPTSPQGSAPGNVVKDS